MHCVVCTELLIGRQREFCSFACKAKGQSNAVYANQLKRAWTRKRELILAKGGKCERCGYDRCLRALTFHHRNASKKRFPLDARNCANRRGSLLAEEAAMCDL